MQLSVPVMSFQTPTKKPNPYQYSPDNDSPCSVPKSEYFQHDYGKAKGIEILSFRGAEVERTFSAQTSFVAAGTLQVIYFEAYNRFILCLNDWKYALLRRMPVISSDTRLQGPISYTLPTCDGFYTLRLIGVENLASLKNFETILANCSKFSYRENVNNSFKGNSSDYADFEHAAPNPLTKSDRFKRGIRKLNSRLTNSFKKNNRPNLNLYQTRDFESLKKTNEMMAPLHMIPKRDIEGLLSLNKSIALKYGFQPETYSSGLQNCQLTPINHSRASHAAFTNPFTSPSPTRGGGGGITTSPQPDKTGSIGNMALNHAVTAKSYGFSQPRLMDRIKAKIPGEHRYYGEKVSGERQMTQSQHSLRDSRRIGSGYYHGTPRRTIKEVLAGGANNAQNNNNESLIDSFTTEQEPYEFPRSPKFGESTHAETLEVARQRSLELVQKYTNDYLAHKERMSRFSTQSKREEENENSIPDNSFGPDLEIVGGQEDRESCEVQLDSRLVGRREAKGLRKRVALKIDDYEENILNLDSILRSEGLDNFEQCEG